MAGHRQSPRGESLASPPGRHPPAAAGFDPLTICSPRANKKNEPGLGRLILFLRMGRRGTAAKVGPKGDLMGTALGERGCNHAADAAMLTEFLADRDERAFERLVARHGPTVLRACRGILDDHAEAEDAFQATFLHLFRRADSIRDRRYVGAWLREVARRVAWRARERNARRQARELRAPAAAEAAPADEAAVDHEWRPILHEEIRRLPPKLRRAVELFYIDGLAVDAVADRLDCPVGTVKSRLSKGREVLRDRLTRRGLAAAVVLLLLFGPAEADAAPEVPDDLIRAAVRGTLGAATPRSRRAAALLDEPTGPPPGRLAPRLGLAVLILLGLIGLSSAVRVLALEFGVRLPGAGLAIGFINALLHLARLAAEACH